MFVVCCLFVSCFLFLVSFFLFLVSCFLFLVSCFLFLVSCFLFVVCCFLFVVCLVFIVYCLLFVYCFLFIVCCLFIVYCLLFIVLLFIVYCLLFIAYCYFIVYCLCINMFMFGIRPSANFRKRKRVESQETRVCFFTARLIKQPNKRPKKGYFPKRRESEDRSAVAIAKSVSPLGLCITRLRCTRILKERKSFGETRCKKPRTQLKEFDSPSLRYVTRVSGTKKRTIAWKSYKSSLDISEATKFEDRSHEETERQER